MLLSLLLVLLQYSESIKLKIQELKLIKYGIADDLNATMTKFVLTNHHEYSERKETTVIQNEPLTELKIVTVGKDG